MRIPIMNDPGGPEVAVSCNGWITDSVYSQQVSPLACCNNREAKVIFFNVPSIGVDGLVNS